MISRIIIAIIIVMYCALPSFADSIISFKIHVEDFKPLMKGALESDGSWKGWKVDLGDGKANGYIESVVKDKEGNTFKVSKSDPRFLSGELIGLGKGKIVINNGSINRMIEKDVEIPEGWTRGYVKRKKTSF